jgi:hypothetical protein
VGFGHAEAAYTPDLVARLGAVVEEMVSGSDRVPEL